MPEMNASEAASILGKRALGKPKKFSNAHRKRLKEMIAEARTYIGKKKQ